MNLSQLEETLLNPFMVQEVKPTQENGESHCELYLLGTYFASTKIPFENYNYIYMTGAMEIYQKRFFSGLYDATHADTIAAIELATWGFDVAPSFFVEAEFSPIIQSMLTQKITLENWTKLPSSRKGTQFPVIAFQIAVILGAMYGYFYPERGLELLENYSISPSTFM